MVAWRSNTVSVQRAPAMPLLDRRQALTALIVAGLRPAFAASPFPARDGAVPLNLRKGFNLPDQVPLRSGQAEDLGVLTQLRRLGMTHVRLPIEAEFFLPAFSGAATIGSATDDLERALDRLLGLGYCVSVDMHPSSDFHALQRKNADAAHSALLAGWRGLAERLARWPSDRVFGELLNEPATSDEIWRPFVETLAQEVRTRLPQTMIIVGPAPFQRVEALARWRPLAVPNIAYAVHYYSPMVFTHQGAEWEKDSPLARMAGVPFPIEANDPTLIRLANTAALTGDAAVASELRQAAESASTPATIMAQFSDLATWSTAHAAPVIVNEFGALRFKSKRKDRLAWLAAVRAAAEANAFGWAHWDLAGGFGILDDEGSLDQGVVHALLGS